MKTLSKEKITATKRAITRKRFEESEGRKKWEKEYGIKNKDKIAAYGKTYQEKYYSETTIEERRQKRLEYYLRNKEAIDKKTEENRDSHNNYQREHYQANKEAKRKRNRDYYHANKEAGQRQARKCYQRRKTREADREELIREQLEMLKHYSSGHPKSIRIKNLIKKSEELLK